MGSADLPECLPVDFHPPGDHPAATFWRALSVLLCSLYVLVAWLLGDDRVVAIVLLSFCRS